MALSKTNTPVEDGTTMTADAADVNGAAQDVSGSYAGLMLIKLTNEATGPTDPAQVQPQTLGDTGKWYDVGGPLVGSTDNNGVSSWKIPYDLGDISLRIVSGSNTDEDVALDFDLTKVPTL